MTSFTSTTTQDADDHSDHSGGDSRARDSKKHKTKTLPTETPPLATATTITDPSEVKKAVKKGETSDELRKLLIKRPSPSDEELRIFTKDARWEDAFMRQKFRDAKRRKANIFHDLVDTSASWDLSDNTTVLSRLMTLTLKDSDKPPKLSSLLEEDINDGTPLFRALTSGHTRNLRFVEGLLKLDPPPTNLGKILCTRSKHGNWPYCIHAAIFAAEGWDFAHIHAIIDHMRSYEPKGNKAPPSPFCEKGSDGNTPLHLAVRKAPTDPRFFGSPQCRTALPDAKPPTQEITSARDLIEALINADPSALGEKNGPRDSTLSEGRTPYQERISHLAQEFRKTHPSTVAVDTEGCMDRQDCEEHEDEDETQSLMGLGHGQDYRFLVREYSFRDDFRKFVINDPVASYISYYCIEHLDRDTARSYLYRPGEELATEFDMLGFPRHTITNSWLQSLETHVRFERTLRYVALPRLNIEVSPVAETTLTSQSQSATIRKSPADMRRLFQWLWDRHVRKIEKVTVIDSEEFSHRDVDIIQCLKGFDVEKLDWEKLDISSEVISSATQSVREIWLHSSGNRAVLEGWAGRDGFGNTDKFPQLTDIDITFREGQEDKKTLEKYGLDFKTALEARTVKKLMSEASQAAQSRALAQRALSIADEILDLTENSESDTVRQNGKTPAEKLNMSEDLQGKAKKVKKVKTSKHRLDEVRAELQKLAEPPPQVEKLRVRYGTMPQGLRGSSSVGGRRVVNSNENVRIARIKELTGFFRNLMNRALKESSNLTNGALTLPPTNKAVKIAIIDDGMDPSLDIVDGKNAKVFAGASFCGSFSEYTNSYFVPSGNHGTLVSSVICQICPKVDLCIARLEEQSTRSGDRVIDPLSAAKAVEWVTECGVDIICMSWTIEPADGDKRLGPLETAIEKARKQGIIMFCSASDLGGSSQVECYPGAFKGVHCIRVGSCSSSDLPSVWVNANQVDFLLPGENIVIKDSDGTSERRTGSSFATAVAAGLGGLLIYSTLCLGIGSAPSSARHHSTEKPDKPSVKGQSEVSDADSDSDEDAKHRQKAENFPPWDRDLMNTMLRSMSIFTDDTRKYRLVKPEKFVIAPMKKKLRVEKSLEKLDWSENFGNALKAILKRLKGARDEVA